MGPALKKMYDNIPDYDKTNYLCLPWGRTAKGKTCYVRIPEDETSRLISGSLWKSAKFIEGNWNDGIKDLAQFWGSQLPTTTPPVESALNWGQFLSGRNPYNSFYRSSIVTPDAFTAGGWPAYKD